MEIALGLVAVIILALVIDASIKKRKHDKNLFNEGYKPLISSKYKNKRDDGSNRHPDDKDIKIKKSQDE